VNSVQMVGNLARDIELKEFNGGLTRGRSLLALSRYGKREGTDYVRIVLWNKQATNAAKYLRKGSRVAVFGHLNSEFYERKGANPASPDVRLDTEVVVDRIEYLSPPPSTDDGDGRAKRGAR
jgi:single-strand DNA-binding protein